MQNYKNKINILFFITGISLSLCFLSTVFIEILAFYTSKVVYPLPMIELAMCSLSIACGFHTHVILTNTSNSYRLRPLIFLIYIISFYFINIALRLKQYKILIVKNGQLVRFFSNYFIAFGIYTIFVTLLIFYLITRSYFEKKDKLHKKKMKFLLCNAVCVGGLAIISGWVLPITGKTISVYFVSLCSIGFFFLAYSIIKYQAFDIKTAIHYTLFWLLSLLILIFPLVIIPLLFSFFSIKHNSIIVLIFWGISCAFYFSILNKLVFPHINKIALRKKKHLESVVQEISSNIGYYEDKPATQKYLAKMIQTNMYAKDLCIVTRESESTYSGVFENSKKIFEIDNIELEWINGYQDSIISQKVLQDMEEKAEPVRNQQIHLIAKLNVEDDLSGLLCLTEKKSLKNYSYEEIKYLDNLAKVLSSHLYRINQLKRASDVASEIIHEVKNTSQGLESTVAELAIKDFLSHDDKDRLKEILIEMAKLHKFSKKHLTLEMVDKVEKIKKERLNLLLLFQESLIPVKPQLKNKQVNVQLKISNNLLVFGDAVLLKIVFVNLIENAVRYLDKKKDIIINAKKQEKEVVISINDFGPGIPEEKQKYLFKAWHKQGQGKYMSSGLGLSLCQKIVKKHKGTINVDSKKYKGTIVTIQLPWE
ncbi:MAG: HAMP domain-containing histidine kinase [bacterium]|nr:HAMP domain-containing histidine kinase [bacterium]